MLKKSKKYIFLVALLCVANTYAQEPADLVLEDPEDMQLLLDEFPEDKKEIKEKKLSQEDELEALKEDLGDIEFTLPEDDTDLVKEIDEIEDKAKAAEKKKPEIIKEDAMAGGSLIFDVGREEKQLLEVAEKMQGKIPEKEWNEIAAASSVSTYTVVPGDWLWKIAKRIFGSGFYYSKIWSLNPYITNPHEIEPGMVLTFTTGSGDSLPEIRVGKFGARITKKKQQKVLDDDEFDKWGDMAKPDWIDEREDLKKQGVYIQYASAETDEDLKDASEFGLIKEYEAYEPPRPPFSIDVPKTEYDESGFDKNAKVTFNFKEGFYLNTFLSTNIVQDFGKIESAIDESGIFSDYGRVYVRFDDEIDVIASDRFSIYSTTGEVGHENSDREGYKYTIVGSVKTIQKHGDLWECEIMESTGPAMRGDRITVYTPKIERITKTFNSRLIEAAILASFEDLKQSAAVGDVVYLDRGRADGVEMGNVFEVYGFKDRATGKNITDNPTYKNAELIVITLTDNFATALVISARRDFYVGDIAITKTKEQAAKAAKLRLRKKRGDNTRIKDEALDELDVELNVEDINDSLLDKADRIQFTEDELAELERQEREKSILTEGERDLRALERLEKEIETAEAMLNEARLDEDKLLENQSLDSIEKNLLYQQQESLDEIEENFGKQYLDEELNDKDNPFGLTEFDIEEIDELLNIEKGMDEDESNSEGEVLE
jgi:hypothetical protein